MPRTLHAIDAHVGGQVLRLVTEGLPTPVGATARRRQQWMADHADELLAALTLEPRGHEGVTTGCFTVSEAAGAHAGVLFRHADGFTDLCGHGLIGAVTIGIERGLLFDREAGASRRAVSLETPAGVVRTMATVTAAGRVSSVAVVLPPALVVRAAVPCPLPGRTARADLAWCGGPWAIVDAESAGLMLDASALPELRRAARPIAEHLAGTPLLAHPVDGPREALEGVVFMGPARSDDAHLTCVAVYPDGSVDRSPGGCATAAVLAVLDAMGLVIGDAPFVQETLNGSRLTARVTDRLEVGDVPAIVPEVTGSAWITGDHVFVIDEDDRLGAGFRL